MPHTRARASGMRVCRARGRGWVAFTLPARGSSARAVLNVRAPRGLGAQAPRARGSSILGVFWMNLSDYLLMIDKLLF